MLKTLLSFSLQALGLTALFVSVVVVALSLAIFCAGGVCPLGYGACSRHPSKEELCTRAFSFVPSEWRSETDRCNVQPTHWIPIFTNVAYIGEVVLSKAPNKFSVGSPFYFDACGRHIRPH